MSEVRTWCAAKANKVWFVRRPGDQGERVYNGSSRRLM